MRKGIVGNGTDKFTELGRKHAIYKIHLILDPRDTLVSGHSPVGGIDIWAEDVATQLGCTLDIKTPEVQQWNPPGGYGYKARNIDIAADSDELHVIVASSYPPNYQGRRFNLCYHCLSDDHVKSGACWTAKQAIRMGKDVSWHYIDNEWEVIS